MKRHAKTSIWLAAAASLLVASPAAMAYSVTAKGRVVYSDGGVNKGLAGARIIVWDSDDGWDDHIGSGYTDANGYFTVSGSADDDWLFCSGCKPDVYVEIELESSGGKVVIESEILKTNYTAETGVHSNTSGTVDFGTFTFSSAEGKLALALFAKTRESYTYFTQKTGQSSIPRHDGKAAILFPSTFAAGVPWTTEESIHWPGDYNSPTTVFHEFAHRIRHAADGDFTHFLADVTTYTYAQQHTSTKVTNNGFAFNEGWGNYYRALLLPSEMDKYSSWTPVNNNANNVEGNVAAKLVALHKKCGSSFSKLWAVLQANPGTIHSYPTFESKMKAKYPTCFATGSLAPTPSRDVDLAPARVAHAGVVGLPGAFSEATDAPFAVSPDAIRKMVLGRLKTADDRLRVIPAPLARVQARQLPPGLAKKSVELINRFRTTRAQKDGAWLEAAHGHLSTYLRGLKPIDLAKDVRAQLSEREPARNALFQKLFDARQAQINELLAEVTKNLAATPDGQERKYLTKFKLRLENRLGALREALAAKDSSSLRLLLPTTFRETAK